MARKIKKKNEMRIVKTKSVDGFSSWSGISMYRFECNQNNFWTIGSFDSGIEGRFMCCWMVNENVKE